ncbi:hypothetical protein B0H13DRAFT_1881926 [Mycena leptocephala]|nr:hypothetical protein B0H13DRAFT_1881926 [Mycena leptocephala]
MILTWDYVCKRNTPVASAQWRARSRKALLDSYSREPRGGSRGGGAESSEKSVHSCECKPSRGFAARSNSDKKFRPRGPDKKPENLRNFGQASELIDRGPVPARSHTTRRDSAVTLSVNKTKWPNAQVRIGKVSKSSFRLPCRFSPTAARWFPRPAQYLDYLGYPLFHIPAPFAVQGRRNNGKCVSTYFRQNRIQKPLVGPASLNMAVINWDVYYANLWCFLERSRERYGQG